MRFTDPYMLFVLWGVFLLTGILVYGIWRRKRIVGSYVGEPLEEIIIPGFSLKKRWIKAGLYMMALVLAVIALSGPLAGYKWVETQQKGVDIMVALDCSRSMLAQDISPTRLERAKREIIDLLRMVESDRVGLVAFAGQAILQCPLTLDYEAFHLFLRVLEPDYLPVGGTNLISAIETCLNAFEPDTDTEKAIILITDGEDTVSDPLEAARNAAAKGVKIFSIGVGSPGGTPVPDKRGGFIKDADGNIVLSIVDEKMLETVSSLTNGHYERSVAGDMDLEIIYYDRIKKTMESTTLQTVNRKVWENRFQWFLFPCIILLLIELALLSRSEKKRKSLATRLVIFWLMIAIPGISHASVFSTVKDGIKAYQDQQFEKAQTFFIEAQIEDPDRPALYYNIGTAAYKNQDYALAEKQFLRAMNTTDPVLKHQSEYNLANTRYRLGKLDEAIAGYESLLEAFPEDTKAIENLEFVRKKKEEQKQNREQESQDNQEPPPEDQDKENQDKKDPPEKGSDNDQKPDDQSPEKQSPGDQTPGDPSPDGQTPEAQTPDSQQEHQSIDTQDQPASSGNEDRTEDQSSGTPVNETILNRLQDKPGQALMPFYTPKNIEKDW